MSHNNLRFEEVGSSNLTEPPKQKREEGADVSNVRPSLNKLSIDSLEAFYTNGGGASVFGDSGWVSNRYYYGRLFLIKDGSFSFDVVLDEEKRQIQTLTMNGIVVSNLKSLEKGSYVRICISERPGTKRYDIDVVAPSALSEETLASFTNRDLLEQLKSFQNRKL